MAATLLVVFWTLRSGLLLRRRRLRGQRGRESAELRRRHLRSAKPAVVLVLVGLLLGVASAVGLRGWAPLGTLHGWAGLSAAALFAAAAARGRALETGRTRSREGHARLALGAALAAAVAAVAGFVLLP